LLEDGKACAIAQLESGEIVMSRDESTGVAAPQRVIRKWVYNSKPTLLLHLTNDDIIETTDPHRFFVSGRGFLAASQLTPGMYLKTQTGSDAQISSIERNVRKTKVYNLLVENFHTYFVGASGVWVHNDKNRDEDDEEGGS
jgi:hypothetical protein